jgi:hypothetical protein
MREELQTISQELVRLRTEPPVVVMHEPAPPPPAVAEPAPMVLDPPEFMPGYVGLPREPSADAEPVAAVAAPVEPAASYVVRRRSGGLLRRLR